MAAMRSSTARAEAIMERPGLDTVHCWSSVLSRVNCVCVCVCVCVCGHTDGCVTTTHISWSHHVTTEVTFEVISRDLGGQLTRRGGVRRNHTRGRSVENKSAKLNFDCYFQTRSLMGSYM